MYYRKDRKDKITGINPKNTTTVVGHINKSKGKKTCFTSISTKIKSIKKFDGYLWECSHGPITNDGHIILVEKDVISKIDQLVRSKKVKKREGKKAKERAEHANECLIQWTIPSIKISPKQLKKNDINAIEIALTKFFKRVP